HLHADAPARRCDPRPIAILDAMFGQRVRMHVETIARGDLPQPAVLRTPGVVHEHGALGDGRERISPGLTVFICGGFVMHRDRMKEILNARWLAFWWL